MTDIGIHSGIKDAIGRIENDELSMEPVKITDRTCYKDVFGSTTAFETDDGIVLVDVGLFSQIQAGIIRNYTDEPIHTAIYTHGHRDHAFGLENYLLEDQRTPEIIAHKAMPARFERYDRTSGHNSAINARQFGGTIESDLTREELFGYPEYPPRTLYEDCLTVTVGGEKFEINHGRGETDDHSWVYCPDREVLCTGDFFVSVAPNAGNPQKVQRFPREWAHELKKMAALKSVYGDFHIPRGYLSIVQQIKLKEI